MKKIFRDKYTIVGYVNGSFKEVPNLSDIDEIKAYIKSLGFPTRGKFKFEKECAKKKIIGYDMEQNPIMEDTLTSLFPTEDFERGGTKLSVFKIRYYSPFSEVLEDDEYLYHINDKFINPGDDLTFLVSDNDRIFSINVKTDKINELKIEKDRDRVKIRGDKYKTHYLISRKGTKYKF